MEIYGAEVLEVAKVYKSRVRRYFERYVQFEVEDSQYKGLNLIEVLQYVQKHLTTEVFDAVVGGLSDAEDAFLADAFDTAACRRYYAEEAEDDKKAGRWVGSPGNAGRWWFLRRDLRELSFINLAWYECYCWCIDDGDAEEYAVYSADCATQDYLFEVIHELFEKVEEIFAQIFEDLACEEDLEDAYEEMTRLDALNLSEQQIETIRTTCQDVGGLL